MNARLAYGRGYLEVEVPPGTAVLRQRPVQPLGDPYGAVAQALASPLDTPCLRDLARGRKRACVVVSDITRPVPYRVVLPLLLECLEGLVGEVVIVVATGTHRPSTPEEKLEMFGQEVVARYRIVDHDSRDPSQLVALGRRTSRGSEVRVNRLYVESDLKILTGLVEPHFMAGYSGGRKAILPGLADLRAVQQFHGPRLLEDPRAASGILEGNPCHEEASETARAVGADFSLNVALDRERRLVGVFAGDLEAAFEAAVARVESYCRASLTEPADIVVTSGGGYPLDKTFYQTVKGMVAALPVVKEGGVVIVASECSEGIGNPEYADLMFAYEGRWQRFLDDIMARDEVVQDQWEFEMQCKVLRRVGVEGLVVCTDGVPPQMLRRLSVTPGAETGEAEPAPQVQASLDAALRRRPGAKVAVLPEGPYVLAELA